MLFDLLVSEGFEWVRLRDEAEQEVLLSLDGRPRRAQWRPLAVERVSVARKKKLAPSAFPWLGNHALVLRGEAARELGGLLEPQGELLPLATDDGVELFVYNAPIIDALDASRASVTYYPGTDRIMIMKRVAFLDGRVEGADVFRLPYRGSSTYVSDRFVERVRAAGLLGLDFTRVWPPAAP